VTTGSRSHGCHAARQEPQADLEHEWARSRVQLATGAPDSSIQIVIDDDDPGLPVEARDAVMQRAVGLDETAPGSSLGLAIARDLAEHYGGPIALGASLIGGLSVTADLPAR